MSENDSATWYEHVQKSELENEPPRSNRLFSVMVGVFVILMGYGLLWMTIISTRSHQDENQQRIEELAQELATAVDKVETAVQGPAGTDGRGISSIRFDDDSGTCQLTITYTSGGPTVHDVDEGFCPSEKE